jgi:hypothetical protein
MRLNLVLILSFLVLSYGCSPEVDKCNNSCGDRAICDENGQCQPKTNQDFYNPITKKYEYFFNIGYETSKNCLFYNYSLNDTPWIFPSLIDIGSTNRFNGVRLTTLAMDTISGLWEDQNVTSYDLTFKRDINNKVTELNIVYVSFNNFDHQVFFDYNLFKKYQNKNVVSSWVGKVSQDRKRIDFTIYFYVNKSSQIFENSDTIKVINRSYVVHPECKSDCRFCFECE